jgi:hypothetical protein
MNNEEYKRPEGMSQEEEARESWRNKLKKIKLADFEDTIATAVTKLVNDPRMFYVCTISKIKYEIMTGANFNVILSAEFKEKGKREETEEKD